MKNGGKYQSLKKLTEAGFLVPDFFVCDPSWTEDKINNEISSKLPEVKYFAVRSSATNEDSKNKSFAGHYYSAVGVAKENIFKEFNKVCKSFDQIVGKIIIQEFIPSNCAGVMFSEVEEGNTIINSTNGLCLPVVNGKACDEFVCKENGEILRKTISNQKGAKFFIRGKIIDRVSAKPSLTNSQVKQVVLIGKKIQKLFGNKQDIEWCFLKEALYILQSRPITRDFMIKRQPEYFDSANIAESYSGIVLPLTQSFATMAYTQIYKDLMRMSGVPVKEIEKHSAVFENLLGFFYGRMYYNMNNWYLMAAFVPGYKRNKENFESMITSNIKENVRTSIKPSKVFSLIYPYIVIFKICIYGITANHFKATVANELRILQDKDFNMINYQSCIKLFEVINKKFLRRWYIAVENDFFVMTYMGILQKLVDKQTLQKVITFPSKSTQQVTALSELSKKMYQENNLKKAIEKGDPKKFLGELEKHTELKNLLSEYLYSFGGRFANELKLESVGIDDDKSKLLSVLKAFRNYNVQPNTKSQKLKLPIFRRIFAQFILGKFKKHASLREEFRLSRSNTFGMARRLFRRMGSILVENGVIEKIDDVFYLNIEEVLAPQVLNKNFAKIVSLRKKEFKAFRVFSPPSHFATNNNLPPATKHDKKIVGKMISANPASPGIIKGRVRIFKEFYIPEKIDFDILVTSHTDPGWTSLIALSKGLIIEHGGVLSHASIVARELNIPAVIGVEDATKYLKNQTLVEIDGSKGTVRII